MAEFTEDLEAHYRKDVITAQENCLVMVNGLVKEFDKFERKLLSDIRKKCKRQFSDLVARVNKEEAEEIGRVGLKKKEREDVEKSGENVQVKMREELEKRAVEEMRKVEEKVHESRFLLRDTGEDQCLSMCIKACQDEVEDIESEEFCDEVLFFTKGK